MADYAPTLPEGVTLPAGRSIDTSHAGYKELETIAREEGWSQKGFSRALGLAVKRELAATSQPPARAPAPKLDFSRMTTSEKFAHALANGPARRPLT